MGAAHSSNKPIKTCADMKGLKIRVPDVPAYLAMPRACGANTAPIAFAEVYLALAERHGRSPGKSLTTIEAKKFYEGAEAHRSDRPHRRPILNTIISASLWKKLSDEDRKIFTTWAQESGGKRPRGDQGQRSQAGCLLQGQGPYR